MGNSTAKADVTAVIEAVRQGLHEKNAAAIVGHYTSGAVIFDLAPPLAHGVDAKGLASWLGTWDGPVNQAARDLSITVSGDAAFCHGLFHVSTRTKMDDEVAWWMRGTFCLTRQDAGWKIAHEHTSVPFHMDGSFRAAIDLAP